MSEMGTSGGGKAALRLDQLWTTPAGVDIAAIADPATLADLIEVLKGLGAFRRTILVQEGNDLDRPGSYIV